jgi:hypothetical protein
MTSATKLELNFFFHTPNIGAGGGYIRRPPKFFIGGPGPLQSLGIDAPGLKCFTCKWHAIAKITFQMLTLSANYLSIVNTERKFGRMDLDVTPKAVDAQQCWFGRPIY